MRICPGLLILSIFLGGLVGHYDGDLVVFLKPIGDVFLYLILLLIIPMMVISLTLTCVQFGNFKELSSLLKVMFIVFFITNIVAAIFALVAIYIFSDALNEILLNNSSMTKPLVLNHFINIGNPYYFLYEGILILCIALTIIFLVIKKKFRLKILLGIEKYLIYLFEHIMYFAPIGFSIYFANLVHQLGSNLIQNYFSITIVFYLLGIAYYMFMPSVYAYFACQMTGFKLFWKNIFKSSLVSFLSCSGMASIIINFESAKAMQISEKIYKSTILLGTMFHKEGSIMAGIFKIVFLFFIYHVNFNDFYLIFGMVLVAFFASIVSAYIPGGGMLGEFLIVSYYGFPLSAFMMIVGLNMIFDPMVTLLNSTGNITSSLIIQKIFNWK